MIDEQAGFCGAICETKS